MDFKNTPTVAGFVGDGMYKYIVAELSQDVKKKVVLRLAPLPDNVLPSRWIEHYTMRSRLRTEVGSEVNVMILGGAGVVIEKGHVMLDGIASTELGPDPDPDQTTRLLQEAFCSASQKPSRLKKALASILFLAVVMGVFAGVFVGIGIWHGEMLLVKIVIVAFAIYFPLSVVVIVARTFLRKK